MRHLLLLLSLIRFLNAYQELLPRSDDDYDGGGENLVYLGKRIFQNPSPESGERLKQWNDTWDTNPEELGDYVEGDIAFPIDMEKNGLIIEAARWPKATIPYVIKGEFDDKEIQLIKKVIKIYETNTCIRFRPKRSSDVDWIIIQGKEAGCWSSVGRKGGPQVVNLQRPACLKRKGTVIHEFLHVVGFIHQQSTWDRNRYVKVEWKNIKEGKEMDFVRRSRRTVTSFGVSYDYDSVMHYSRTAFSKNGQPTIVPKARGAVIGQRKNFSRRDIKKILLMYNCPTAPIPKKSGSDGKEKQIYNFIFIILFKLFILL